MTYYPTKRDSLLGKVLVSEQWVESAKKELENRQRLLEDVIKELNEQKII